MWKMIKKRKYKTDWQNFQWRIIYKKTTLKDQQKKRKYTKDIVLKYSRLRKLNKIKNFEDL